MEQHPPDGRLLFHRVEEDASDSEGWLFTVDASGDHEERLPHRPYSPVGHYDVAPSGDGHIAAVVVRDDGFGLAVVGTAGVLLRTVLRSETKLACPAWDGRGERLLVNDELLGGLELVSLGPTVDARFLDLPFAVTGCADFAPGDRLVVQAAEETGVDTGVWTVGLDGRDPEPLYTPRYCTAQVGGVDPAGEWVAVAQSCATTQDSGVVVVDLATGDVTRVATGFAALPRWSPDGEWLTFGLIPLAQREWMGVWIARADGTGLRQVVEGPASYPVWLPG